MHSRLSKVHSVVVGQTQTALRTPEHASHMRRTACVQLASNPCEHVCSRALFVHATHTFDWRTLLTHSLKKPFGVCCRHPPLHAENIPELSRLLTEPYRDRSDTESVPTTTTDTDIDTQRYAAESLATLAEKSRGVSTMVLASCDLPTLQTILSQCKDTGVLCAVVRILSRSNKVWSQKEDGPLFTELLRLTQMQHAELQGRAVKLLGTFAKYDMRFAIELDQSSAFKRLLWHQDAFVRTEAQRVMQGAQKVAR